MKQLLFLLIFLQAAALHAQVTESGHVSVSVAQRILSLNTIQDLYFGTVHPSGQNGVVRVFPTQIDPNSSTGHNSENGVMVSGSPTHGIWEIAGDPFSQVQVSFPASSVTITDGSHNMTLDQLDTGGQNFTLDADGVRRFAVRATLHVSADQPAGDYSGTYEVTVSYE